MLFTQLTNIKPFILKAIQEINFKQLTPVQEKVIPRAIQGENLIVQSHTGTGKTHAFLIPIFNAIDPSVTQVQAVITAPSRELAEQLYQAAIQINHHATDNIQIELYIGGTNKYRQIDRLQTNQQPQIVIGTPGRIYDLMSEHALWVQTTRILVVDEADMTLDLGFLPIVDNIASRMPAELQMMVFSATIPQGLQVFLNKYMTAPEIIRISDRSAISPFITNYVINIRGRDSFDLLYEILTLGQPYLALIFANTIEKVNEIYDYLQSKSLNVAKIHGDISSRERKRVMKQIRDLEYQYVVATDLAARGIDIPGTSMVINMELPTDLDFFIHRIGRTGRNNIPGEAYTLISPDDLDDVDLLTNKGIPFKWVDIEEGELIEMRQRRQKREEPDQEVDPEIHRIVNQTKRKKVKPGYKRKMKQKIKQRKRQIHRDNLRKKK